MWCVEKKIKKSGNPAVNDDRWEAGREVKQREKLVQHSVCLCMSVLAPTLSILLTFQFQFLSKIQWNPPLPPSRTPSQLKRKMFPGINRFPFAFQNQFVTSFWGVRSADCLLFVPVFALAFAACSVSWDLFEYSNIYLFLSFVSQNIVNLMYVKCWNGYLFEGTQARRVTYWIRIVFLHNS